MNVFSLLNVHYSATNCELRQVLHRGNILLSETDAGLSAPNVCLLEVAAAFNEATLGPGLRVEN